ncbi:MAG: hypothetical protein ACKOJF_18260, partial [Planctomycetaceae bacterium]
MASSSNWCFTWGFTGCWLGGQVRATAGCPAPRSPAHWQPALDYIAQDPSLEEVLLSGGDPLVLSDNRLGW